ncbi:hypothetical protein QE152_g8021 [Popillia japonica]|uniref:Uncharacterized protein n=1 Tax=Popillia japonica TaxID=7064 RepID=A0AAW1MCG4_POPJA
MQGQRNNLSCRTGTGIYNFFDNRYIFRPLKMLVVTNNSISDSYEHRLQFTTLLALNNVFSGKCFLYIILLIIINTEKCFILVL